MAKPDRAAFARKHAAWLVPACGAVLVLGFLRENAFAIAAAVGGLIWIGRAFWIRK